VRLLGMGVGVRQFDRGGRGVFQEVGGVDRRSFVTLRNFSQEGQFKEKIIAHCESDD